MSNNHEDRIAVVYLMWLPMGIDYFKKFIRSYLRYSPGEEHRLFILFNSPSSTESIEEYIYYLQQYKIDYAVLRTSGVQDLNAYAYAAKQINATYILFLNTYSCIQAENWLTKYYTAIRNPSTGLVGASASNESYYSSILHNYDWRPQFRKGISHNIKKYKLLLKVIFYWPFFFKSFPNPHIRTNSFMIRREDFLKANPPLMKTKFKAYLFENGRKSITNYFLKKGLKAVIVDKNGAIIEQEQWVYSKTFWMNNQENLLITDNQTEVYDKADEMQKKRLTFNAWGI